MVSWRKPLTPRRAVLSDVAGGGSRGHHPQAAKSDPEQDELRYQQGLAVLKAARKGDAGTLQLLLEQGAPVDFVDPVDHATALHYVAAYDARPALRVLLKSGKCDFLVRDWEGRLPSEIAREYGLDYAMARLLLIKEVQQAQAQGIDPDGLYKISSRKPSR
jgi:ankyrin repeat protein